jgi:Tfp pilus assembly protein PilF
MPRHPLTLPALLLALLLGAASTFAQPALPLAHEELLHSARTWEARERGDLAILALQKLVAARPDSSDALLELGELYLRLPDIAAAGRVRELLEHRFKGSTAAKTFEIEYRFATRDRLQLASLQRLRQLDRGAQLRSELQRLFPAGAPGGMLSIEYYRLLANTPGGYASAVAGLRELAALRADDPRVQLALARLLLRRPETLEEGMRRLHALTQRDDVKLFEVDDVLLDALKGLGPQTPAHVLRGYLARHPSDPLTPRLLAVQFRAAEEQRLLFADASAAMPPDLRRQLLDELGALLWSPVAGSAESSTQLLLALHATTVEKRHRVATYAAAAWLGRAHRSAARGQIELATAQLAAARALRRGEFDALPSIAEHVAALAQPEQSSELLELATRLAPRSSWLFATYIRSLLSAQREAEALALLEARRLDAQWTATARDELRASALEQRAQRALDGGDQDQARADFELAVRYAPTHPWTRYRLAGLYAQGGEPERGRQLFTNAVPSTEMHYAHSLYASGIDALDEAFAAIDAVTAAARSPGMQAQHDRLRVQLARRDARHQHQSGDAQLARATLLAVEPLASQDLELTRELAFAWIDIDEPRHALELIDTQRRGEHANDRGLLLVTAEILDRLDAVEPLGTVLDQLRAGGELPSKVRTAVARLQRSLDLRQVRRSMQEGQYPQALRRLDEALAGDPNDRTLRILRAELDLAMQQPRAARDRYAVLVAEDPDDLDTRLSYVRALTEAGDLAIARAQLRAVQENVAADATELQLDIARRQLALNDTPGAVRTLEAVHALLPERADVLLALGRAELSQRNFARARAWFARAERSPDAKLALQARQAGAQLDLRLQSHVESGFEIRNKPGVDGISRYEAVVAPNAWLHALDFEHRLRVHADAVSIDSGQLSPLFDAAAQLGTLQVAGLSATRRTVNQPQNGLSLGVGFETDTWSADLGTSGLGLLLPNLVGGIEWNPTWGALDVTLGIDRRAVTSSVLSFAGMRDPITGEKWGGVVETGPYARVGLYRERYSLSAALSLTDLSGTHVAGNRFAGLRTAAEWQFYAAESTRAYLGVTLNRWSYQRNLQNYTFGSAGYYSPQSYLSIALPLELQGTWRGWSYQLRTTISNSTSRIERTAFYLIDPQLQAAAATAALPSGFSEPFFAASSGGGLSLSAYAALERQVTPHLVLGTKLDLDRSDFYEPTVLMFYLRHVFGSAATRLAVPPRPVRTYNR